MFLYFFFLIPLFHTFGILSMENYLFDNIVTECIKNKLIVQQNDLTTKNDIYLELNSIIEWITIAQFLSCIQKKYRLALRPYIINAKIGIAQRTIQNTFYLETIHKSIELATEHCHENNFCIARALGTFLITDTAPEELQKKLKKQFFDLLENCADQKKEDASFIQNVIQNILPSTLIKQLAFQSQPKKSSKKPIDLFIEHFLLGTIQYNEKKYAKLSLNPTEIQQYNNYNKCDKMPNIKAYCTTGHFNSPEYAILHIEQ